MNRVLITLSFFVSKFFLYFLHNITMQRPNVPATMRAFRAKQNEILPFTLTDPVLKDEYEAKEKDFIVYIRSMLPLNAQTISRIN